MGDAVRSKRRSEASGCWLGRFRTGMKRRRRCWRQSGLRNGPHSAVTCMVWLRRFADGLGAEPTVMPTIPRPDRIDPRPVTRWFTDSAIEVPIVTTEQMREIDRVAVEQTGPNLFQVMENAGRNLALQVMEILGATWNRAA